VRLCLRATPPRNNPGRFVRRVTAMAAVPAARALPAPWLSRDRCRSSPSIGNETFSRSIGLVTVRLIQSAGRSCDRRASAPTYGSTRVRRLWCALRCQQLRALSSRRSCANPQLTFVSQNYVTLRGVTSRCSRDLRWSTCMAGAVAHWTTTPFDRLMRTATWSDSLFHRQANGITRPAQPSADLLRHLRADGHSFTPAGRPFAACSGNRMILRRYSKIMTRPDRSSGLSRGGLHRFSETSSDHCPAKAFIITQFDRRTTVQNHVLVTMTTSDSRA